MSGLSRLRQVYERRSSAAMRAKYSPFRAGELYMMQQRERATLSMLRRAGYQSLKGVRILEVGCGRGARLADFLRWGADAENLAGVDVMPGFIDEARAKYPALRLSLADATRLPFTDGAFDIVMQSTLFSSLLDPSVRKTAAAEMTRVLRRGGAVLWYDVRLPNPWNSDLKPIGEAELRALFPQLALSVRSLTLLPPLARSLAPLSFTLCRLLEALPFLRSHYLALGIKTAASG
jgi:ubiquinone/menaquinone biosynthesis C-methylase UbiE